MTLGGQKCACTGPSSSSSRTVLLLPFLSNSCLRVNFLPALVNTRLSRLMHASTSHSSVYRLNGDTAHAPRGMKNGTAMKRSAPLLSNPSAAASRCDRESGDIGLRGGAFGKTEGEKQLAAQMSMPATNDLNIIVVSRCLNKPFIPSKTPTKTAGGREEKSSWSR